MQLVVVERAGERRHRRLGVRRTTEKSLDELCSGAILFNRHHGEDSVGVLVKASGQDEMAQLIDAEPEIYFRPAYYGPSDWIGIRLDRPGVDWDHVAEWLAKSWRICAPPRLTKLLRAADEF